MPPTTTAEARASSRGPQGKREAAPWTGALRDVVELGRGGMGVVWLVLDDEGRSFARKSLLPELTRSKEKRELFLREARVALELRHPNVVRTHEVGDRDGEPYLVMDFVDGLPLDRLLARSHERGERLPRALAAHLVACLARGLHAAHELVDADGKPLNLVHRDVSPQNVMVSRDGDVVLLDFGVAKTDSAQGLTKTGEVRGKTAYMSPEQGLGDSLDRRSDLFALGALLYECVEDARMWGGGTELDVLRKLALETAPRLSGDDALADLHASLVARDPNARPATALEVCRRLVAYTRDGDTSDEETHATRRAELSQWVERVAEAALDERARALSSAIEPVRASLPGPAPLEGAAADEPSGVVSKTHPRRRSSRTAAVTATVLVAALGVTLAYAATRTRTSTDAGTTTTPTSSALARAETFSDSGAHGAAVAPTSPSAPSPSPSASSLTSASASLAPSGRIAAHPIATAASETRPHTTSGAPSVAPSSSTAPKPSAHRPLNVDPTPF